MIVEEVPDLRIVSDELWNAVKARQKGIRESDGVTKARATRFWEQRRAQHLLSGLVHCGSCGSRFASVGRDYLACSAARGQGTCSNRKGVRRSPLEELIVQGAAAAPDGAREGRGVRHRVPRGGQPATPGRDRQQGRQGARAGRGSAQARQADRSPSCGSSARSAPAASSPRTSSRSSPLIEGYRTAGLQQRLEELEAKKAALEQELTTDPPPPVRLHPNLAQVYRGKVERLHEALAAPALRDEALGILRGLIEQVVIHPGEDGLQVEVVGEIVKMIERGLDAKQAALPQEAACSVKVVAGVGFEPTTFR